MNTICEIRIDDELLKSYAHALHLEATRTAKSVGFGYRAVDSDEPVTLSAMTSAMMVARWEGGSYPVSGNYCAESLVGKIDPSANVALRYVHDMQHLAYDLTTSVADEIELGYRFGETMARYGKRVGQLVVIDMVGSTMYEHTFGHFPTGRELRRVWDINTPTYYRG